MSKRPGTLPRGYLARPGGQWRWVDRADRLLLAACLRKADSHPAIGPMDAFRTTAEMLRRLKSRWVDPSVLESALASARFLDEEGEFTHPEGISFDEWLKAFLRPNETLHPNRNYFEKVKPAEVLPGDKQ